MEEKQKNIKKHLIFRKTCHIILLASRETSDAGHARLAQLAEHLTLNQGVQGSNPWWRITKYRFYSRWLWGWCFFLFNLYCVISNIKLPIRNRAAIILKTRSKLRRLCFFVNKLYTTCN